MPNDIILSTVYLPPAEYFYLIKRSGNFIIEKEENYIRQTSRNRCRILAANGIMTLSVPVIKASGIKSQVKDITIDYSKRWQQVHHGAITSAYGRSPYFEFYYYLFEKIIQKNHKFLIDLNDALLAVCLEILKIEKSITHTASFISRPGLAEDYRIGSEFRKNHTFHVKPYIQVFSNNFVQDLSIIDMIFNVGPESYRYL